MEHFIKTIVKQAGAEIKKRFGKIGAKYTKAHVHDTVKELTERFPIYGDL